MINLCIISIYPIEVITLTLMLIINKKKPNRWCTQRLKEIKSGRGEFGPYHMLLSKWCWNNKICIINTQINWIIVFDKKRTLASMLFHVMLSFLTAPTLVMTLHCTLLHCTDLRCTAQYCIALIYTALYCTWLHWATLYCTSLHWSTLYCTSLHWATLHCIVLHWAALYSSVLNCSILHCYLIYSTNIS